MKFTPVFLILVIFCDGTLARNNLEDAIRAIAPIAFDSEVTVGLLQEFAQKFVPLVLENVAKYSANEEKAPVIPPLPDQILLPDGHYAFNITDTLVGDLSVRNQEIGGLSTIEDSLEIQLACEPIFGFGVVFDMNISSVLFQGEYETDLVLGLDSLTGNGTFRLGVEETTVGLDMVIAFQQGVPDKLQIRTLTLDLFIVKLILFAENFVIGGYPIGDDEWEALSENIRQLIEDSWPALQGPISTLIQDVINDVIKDCTIIDYLNFIIGGGDLSCLRVPTIHGRISLVSDPIREVTDKTYIELLPLLIARAEETGFARDFMISILMSAIDRIRGTNILNNMGPGQGRVSLLPPFDDPLVLEDGVTPFQLLGILQGNISMWDGVIEGLSTIDDDLTFGLSLAPFGLKLNFTLAKLGNVVSVGLRGNHSSEFDILLPPIKPIRVITGDGELKAEIKNAGFKIGTFIGLQTGRPTHVQFNELSLDLGYDDIELFAENVFFGDCLLLPVYWQGITDFIRRLYNLLWANNPDQELILNFITRTINEIIWECNIPRLLYILAGSGDTSCMSAPWQGTTTTSPRPTTTTTPGITTTPTIKTTTSTTTSTSTDTTTTAATTTTSGSSTTTTQAPPPPSGAQNLKSLSFELFAILIFTLVYSHF